MSNEIDFDAHETMPAPVVGGRACRLPVDALAPRGPWGMRRPKRVVASTGVVSADVVVEPV
ncbi:hypothetical protein [Saccharopolyspora thermophila]|uniref:Uncharacterized protein n=1 Tax=Saccharopolyspora thermophila TaxID=89367 RepID=A0ABN1CEV4_9PSEU